MAGLSAVAVLGAACSDSGTTASTGTGGAGASMSSTTSGSTAASTGSGIAPGSAAKPVFIVLMENHNWVDIKGSASAPYLNQTLLPLGAHAEQAFNPPNLHPSEPNYIYLEAGDNLGILGDSNPSINHKDVTDHLVTFLETANLSWRSYQEDIPGTDCPLEGVGKYAPKHNPMVFFDDVTNTNDPTAPRCIEHVRPYTELATDLANDTVGDYNFLTPNLCNDGHDLCAPQNDQIKQTDDWLAANIPPLLASKAYMRGGVVIITWDEGEENSDGPIGLIVLSKNVKAGFESQTHYTHASTLKTIQEFLGVTPLLRHAGDAGVNDLSDMFTTFP